MVKSLVLCVYACATKALEPNHHLEDKDGAMLVQQRHQIKVGQGDEATTISRLTQVFEQMDNGVDHVCIAATAGEDVPIAGLFSSEDGAIQDLAMSPGDQVPGQGKFCAEAVTLSMIQRSLGVQSIADVEQALEGKKRNGDVEGSTRGKNRRRRKTATTTTTAAAAVTEGGDKGGDPKSDKGGDPKSHNGGDGTKGDKGGDPKSHDGGDGTKGDGTKSDKGGDGAAVAKLEMCGDKELVIWDNGETWVCEGSSKDGCDPAHIKDQCTDKGRTACCNDSDGSCTDGDYSVGCYKTPTTKPAKHPDPEVAKLEMCGDKVLESFTKGKVLCAGQNKCNADKLKVCTVTMGWIPCCSDPDGSCNDGDDSVGCYKNPDPAKK